MQFIVSTPSSIKKGNTEFPELPWTAWFAWYPVKVHEQYKWLTTVVRRPNNRVGVTHKDFMKWEYGDMFDLLKVQ